MENTILNVPFIPNTIFMISQMATEKSQIFALLVYKKVLLKIIILVCNAPYFLHSSTLFWQMIYQRSLSYDNFVQIKCMFVNS